MTRGRVLRYLSWQVLDRAGPRLGACLLLSAGFMIMLHLVARKDPPSPEQAVVIQGELHQQLSFAFVLLLVNGLVAQDRTMGWYRFYLAKPVSPLWFYGQHLALALAATLLATAGFVVAGWLALGSPAGPQWGLLRQSLAMFAIFGMLIAVFSTLTKNDWVIPSLLLLATAVVRNRWPRGESAAGDVLHLLLPPTQLLGWNDVPSAGHWAWLAAWGLGLFALTLLLLRRRPLGEG